MLRLKCTSVTVMLLIGICFTIITLMFMTLSFSTNYWVSYTVNRDNLTTNQRNDYNINGRYTYSRHRGLFRECYPVEESGVFLALQSDTIDNSCFFVDLDIPDTTFTTPSNHYMNRVHLLRTCIAFFIIGIVLLIAQYVLGMVILCYRRRSKYAFIASFLSCLVAVFDVAAIAFWHGAFYLEQNKITDTVDNVKFFNSWDFEMKIATDSNFGWSYVLGWISFCCAIFIAIAYFITGSKLSKRHNKKRPNVRFKPGRIKARYNRNNRYNGIVHPWYLTGRDGMYMNYPYIYEPNPFVNMQNSDFVFDDYLIPTSFLY
ncbi:unnamed protein product [Mytilus coruscus]|uniref:Uncharacterized protein n=1 Tax=Mytilus coruscus TaxID=42192 RepID=A0A6J8BVF9_MYTCO|nr:unnamed protein product [Mytilus coruscus]